MNKFKLGIMPGCFRLGLEEGIRKSAEMGAQGVQLYAGEVTSFGKKETLNIIKGSGLVVSALCAEMGGFIYQPLENPEKIEKTKKIMDMALEMETGVVTAHIGVVPEDRNIYGFKILQDVLGTLGEYGEKIGVKFAIETGPEKAMTLKNLLDSINSRGLAVNFDPANLVMVAGDDPVKGVYTLRDYIVHTHAKDGIMLRPSYPEKVYGGNVPEEYVRDDGKPDFIEMPLGQGRVDYRGWMKALDDIGYHGFLTIEREVGESPEKDIKIAADFLNSIDKELFQIG